MVKAKAKEASRLEKKVAAKKEKLTVIKAHFKAKKIEAAKKIQLLKASVKALKLQNTISIQKLKLRQNKTLEKELKRREKREEKKFLKKQAKERKIAIKKAKNPEVYNDHPEVKKEMNKEKRVAVLKRLIKEQVKKLD